MNAPCLSSCLRVARPGFQLAVEVDAEAGQVVALLGPNGAGKSTVLRALAGLSSIDSGYIVLDGVDITMTPTEARPIGMVFQDYLLFPRMNVIENVAFGPRCQGVNKRRAQRAAAVILERMGLGEHAHKRPALLSGGQAQRVALARALAVQPRLLLLDEPLAALDANTRLDIRTQLRNHLSEFTGGAIVVTHDPMEAMVLADQVAIIEHGSIVQHGKPVEIARQPRTEYVAQLVGLNLYRGQAQGAATRVHEGSQQATVATRNRHEGDVFLTFPPRAVALYSQPPTGSPRNLWPVVVNGVETLGDLIRVKVTGPITLTAEITAAALGELRLRPGDEVWASIKAAEITVYPR